MIRIEKSEQEPKDLQTGYNSDGVCRQLLIDQHHKCYLCERKLGTDYQVEHLHSQNSSPEQIKDWKNLFASCSYCNRRKWNSFDEIIDPSQNNIEQLIEHSIDAIKKKAVFKSDNHSQEINKTIELLTLLFNGKSFRKYREERFYDEFLLQFNYFSSAIDKYLSGEKEKYKPIIEELLDIDSEYLGFKYTVICDDPILYKDFANLVRWNKR